MSHINRLFDKPYRHRFPLLVIKLAVVLHAFLPSKDVKALLYYLFRARVSHKTVCWWSKKFAEFTPPKKIKYKQDDTVILYADEKFVKIKEIKAYWWSVRDHLGNVLSYLVTKNRDSASAKRLFRRAKQSIAGGVHAVVHDGLKSYDKPVRSIFGRKCKSIVAGIKGRFEFVNKKLFWITNNSAESLNAQIDCYISKHHYNFNNLESANQCAEMFMYRRNLREVCS